MSTSLLYHAFGIRGYDYLRTDYQDGQVHLHHPPGAADLPLPGLRLARRRAARPRRTPLPDRAHRRQADVRRPAHPARRMPGLWRGPPGRGPLRRPAAELHPVLRAVRPGAVAGG